MNRKWAKTQGMYWSSKTSDLFDVNQHDLFDVK